MIDASYDFSVECRSEQDVFELTARIEDAVFDFTGVEVHIYPRLEED